MLPDKKKKQIIASTFQALLRFFPYFPSRLNYFLLVMVSRSEIFPNRRYRRNDCQIFDETTPTQIYN